MHRLLAAAMVFAVTVGSVRPAQAEDPVHSFRGWDSFPVGAWKHVRVVKQTLTPAGSIASTSTAETRTSVVAVDEQGVKLSIAVTVEVANHRLPTTRHEVWYGLNGEPRGQELQVEKQPAELVDVGSERITAQVYQLKSTENALRRVTRVYMAERFPYLLRKQSTLVDARSEMPEDVESLEMDIVALDLPYPVFAELRTAAHVRTIARRGDSRTDTIEVYCEEVPGWVVAHWSKRLDSQGQVVERSTLELVDYGLEDPAPAPRPGRRLFNRRARRGGAGEQGRAKGENSQGDQETCGVSAAPR